MLIKINRQDCLKNYPSFPLRSYNYDKDEEEFYYPEVFKSYILTLTSKSFKGHIKQLATGLLKLTKQLGYDRLIFLGDTELPWLNQDNNYKPAKEAQQYLVDNKIGKRFNGALQIESSGLQVFVKHLSWLTRCNAGLPYFHFTDKEQNIIGNICKYGNLHLDTLNEKTDTLVKAFVDASKFLILEDNNCFNQFGKANAIGGRRIIV
ncbi:hypothetical protein [Foetidibacter luteolus]|uniref:hypothetical protein n=1 Tax=Foetidibacter luteolus TaxID=2608880 RepID=UPI00129A63C4|nr:hypothetical protein [Foetidibacter luteolus]